MGCLTATSFCRFAVVFLVVVVMVVVIGRERPHRHEAVGAGLAQSDEEPSTGDAGDAENAGRIVLFHSPPVLSGADASLIGALVDQAVLAIIANRTTRAQAKQAQDQLQRAQVKLAGIVMVSI